MQLIAEIAVLVIAVLLCEKYKAKLPFPINVIYGWWEAFAKAFGLVMSSIILAIFWIVAIGTYAVITKIIRMFSFKEETDTYWITSEPHPAEAMKRQF